MYGGYVDALSVHTSGSKEEDFNNVLANKVIVHFI
jgi:hypothetical protein